ncbi:MULTISPECIES: DUF1120 domain-containing protein [Pseudomonas]|uniref:DUF1120 domain-containing protein n=1 Tax=Pseudomonas izuensis TaxID=2684212 RepID=A0ABM7S4M4_9PSED|nr:MULTISPECIES: DUF1120 domain-containing protein [Pseudomonas]RKS18651.1 uncharacterized protein DUF1120 [Pseudomonas sp. WPR_5_2]BCX70348.1 DUF1120 domain-containing protein [Pseudomonas izuensis]
MNKMLTPLLGAMLLTGSASVFAASSVDLTVTGIITPSACTPTLSKGGTVDYGKISAKDLKPDLPTYLTAQQVQLNVNCDAATLMALESKDNRAGSAFDDDTYNFGLGLINGSEKLGVMELKLLSPLADGVSVTTIASEDGGSTWYNERYLFRTNILSVADTGTVVPRPVQSFTSDLVVQPRIAPANQLTLTNEVSIDGSVTLTVRYL